MKRKVFFVGEHLKYARVKVIEVIQPPEGKGHDCIRYLVECDQCRKKRTLAHSTLRQRIHDRSLACNACSMKDRDYDVKPPAWPVPPMVMNEREKV